MDYLVHLGMSEEIDNHEVEGIHRMKIITPSPVFSVVVLKAEICQPDDRHLMLSL